LGFELSVVFEVDVSRVTWHRQFGTVSSIIRVNHSNGVATMKCLSLVVLMIVPAIVACAQTTTTDRSGVEIVKFNWTKERLGWEGNPFNGPIENFDEVRARTRNEKRIEDAKRGNSADIDKIRREAKADAANIEAQHKNPQVRYAFVYKTTLRNATEKTITSVDWDYVFVDRGNETELGRQQFTSDEKIAPGKTKELSVVASKPPTQTISVTSLNTSERDSLSGRIIIVRLQFSDGSLWQQPQ
jgi:hypothetical protein